MKHLLLILLTAFLSISSFADNFTTAGDGTTYSFEKLSATANSGVSKISENEYLVTLSTVIAAADKFVIDEQGTVYFANNAELIIDGEASLVAGENGITLTKYNEDDTPYSIEIHYDGAVTDVKNITFEFVGLKNYSTAGLNVSDCTFREHNGSSSGALFLGTDGAEFTVENCTFELCRKAAIGGAANFFCPIKINNCTFRKNSQNNSNIPQLNLTAATDVTITNCEIEGDPALNMVGGIGVSNFMAKEGMNLTITNCNIYNNRYGISPMGSMNVVIADNIIKDNCYETNANNGGSGISLYDPYKTLTAKISGNTISGNLWGITVIGCADVNIGRTGVSEDAEEYNRGENIFDNNGNNGVLYDLYNNSDNTVYAQNNTWGVDVQDAEHIETVIFHKFDDDKLGEVIYLPAFDKELSVSAVELYDNRDGSIYNLNGQRLTKPAKGIMIVGGKKIICKQ